MSLYQTFKRMQTGPVMIVIAIFGLITFTITGAVMSSFTSEPGRGQKITVTLPSGSKASLGDEERTRAYLAQQVFFGESGNPPRVFTAVQLMRALGSKNNAIQMKALDLMLAMPRETDRKKQRDESLQFMLMSAIAHDRGIAVAQSEISTWVSESFESAEQYKQACEVMGVSVAQFEAALREALLLRRFADIALAQTPIPSGDEIVAAWAEKNERFTFEIVELSAADRRKTIDPASIQDADLQKYLDDLTEFEKSKYKVAETFELEGLAVLNAALEPGAKLSDAFEALVAATEVQEKDAAGYLSLAQIERFQKPAPPPEPRPEGDTRPASIPAIEYFKFEEVKERVMRETRVARALEKVRAEAMDALTKPGFDLKAIGDKYGLTYWRSGEGRTPSELAKYAIHGTFAMIMPLQDAKEGEFLPTYQPAPGAIEITRVSKRNPARVPPAIEIRGKLIEPYIEAKAIEKTKTDADAFSEAVAEATGDDRFARIAKEKGLEPRTLAPISKGRSHDPEFGTEPKDVAHFLALQRSTGGRKSQDPFELAKGAVSSPLIDSEAKAVYVVHVVDRSLPTIADMGPSDYLGNRDSLLGELRQKKFRELFSVESLTKTLDLKRPD